MKAAARLAGVLSASAVAVLPLLAATPGSAAAAPAAAPRAAAPQTALPQTALSASPDTPGTQVAMTLTAITPQAPQPTDTVTLTGTVRNTTGSAIPRLSIELFSSSQYVLSRSQFDHYADTPDTMQFTDLQYVTAVTPAQPRLLPGASETWSISEPVAGLDYETPWEVYEVGVAAVSDAGTEDAVTQGRLRTFIPYAPIGTPGNKPLRVSWVWPLIDRPHHDDPSAPAAFTDDSLASSLTPNGRLGRLLVAAKRAATQRTQPPPPPPRPTKHRHGQTELTVVTPPAPILPVHVTYAIDPMLISDARLMEHPYTVQTPTGSTAGTGQTAAKAWLSTLSAFAAKGHVIALPYADPDIVAAVRAGPVASSLVQLAVAAGRSIVKTLLGGNKVLDHWAWPPDGLVNDTTLDTLYESDVTHIVLNGAAVPSAPVSETPDAHVKLFPGDGKLTGVAADKVLSAVVDNGAEHDSGLHLQRYLAETLMIEAEAPTAGHRSIVIAPGQRWAPRTAYATELLKQTGRVPWLRPAALTAAAKAPVSAGSADDVHYGPSDQRAELQQSYIASVGAVSMAIESLQAVLPAGAAAPEADATLAWEALSSAWRSQPHDAAQFVSNLDTTVTTMSDEVYIASSGTVTLTSHSGTVPITVANKLDVPASVRVHITPEPRLRVSNNNQLVTVGAGQRVAVDLHATANTSGQFSFQAQLWTPKNQSFGRVHTLTLKSTAYGTVALIITGGAFAVLLIAVATRLGRRAVAARRAARAGG